MSSCRCRPLDHPLFVLHEDVDSVDRSPFKVIKIKTAFHSVAATLLINGTIDRSVGIRVAFERDHLVVDEELEVRAELALDGHTVPERKVSFVSDFRFEEKLCAGSPAVSGEIRVQELVDLIIGTKEELLSAERSRGDRIGCDVALAITELDLPVLCLVHHNHQ